MGNQQVIPPEAIDAVYMAFDGCWTLLAPALAGQPQAKIDAVRELLTNALINAACTGHADPADLQQEGIRALKSTDLAV